jgi:AAA domain
VYSPAKFPARIGNIGSALPDPFNVFGANQIHFRHGATSMIAGAPGSFKSILALNMLAEWARLGIGVMYFSADSDEFTVIKRLSAILTGDNLDTVEGRILRRQTGRYVAALRKVDSVQFEYEQMDMATIANRVKSYEQIYGSPPDVIFVDNLIDFVDSPDDWGGMLIMTRELDALAKEIKAHVVVLHHAKLRMAETSKRPEFGRPPADYEIQGKITQIPRLVLTVAAENLSLKLSCVKNTNGPQTRDASLSWGFQVRTNMRLADISAMTGNY